MTSSMLRGVRRSLGLLAAGTILGAGGAAAQALAQVPSNLPPGAVVQPLPGTDSGAELRRHLADLGANPRSLTSLIGAGRAAVAVGDGNAAIGFFSRAAELAPRDARVKAGMGSALVLLEQPGAALRAFSEASQLGAPEQEIARDRGLAYDMSGNPRRAQQDYMLVLQRGEDAETRRRLALSLAISGHREAALRTLDPLIQRRDRPAYRTRAFVLALTGDANGAVQAVDAALPGQGQAMSPFLARLAGLNPAQKALAVHFGHFPADGRPVQMAQGIDTSALPAAVAMSGAAPTPSASGRTTAQANASGRRRVVPQPVTSDPRRLPGDDLDRSGRAGSGTRSAAATPQPRRDAGQNRTAAAAPMQPVRRDSGQSRGAAAQPVRTVSVAELQRRDPSVGQPQARAAAPAPAPTPVFQQPVTIASSAVAVPNVLTASPAAPAAAAPRPGFASTPPAAPTPAPGAEPIRIASAQSDIPPAMRQDSPPPPIPSRSEPPVQPQTSPPPSSAPAPAPSPAFSDIAALVQSLPTEEPAPTRTAPAPTPARQPAAAPARAPATTAARTPAAGTRTAAAGTATARARTPAAPAHPARHWVQIANGVPGALSFELGRIRRAAPELMQGRTAWSAANGASGRLLVGPFATTAEARTFINQLARKDVEAFPWSSRAGEEVARLPAR